MIAAALGAAMPEGARRAAWVSLADGLAVMAAAPALESATHPFAALARGSGSGERGASLLAGGAGAPGLAALANGALSHALDFEDTDDGTGMHPHGVAIPALLALAEAEGANLGALVEALAVAGDATCRLARALRVGPAGRGWYHPPMLGAAGAALGAARLLGLSTAQAEAALSLALVQFSLTDALKRAGASDLRAVRDGFAARAVVEGALLARAGVRGADDPLCAPGGLIPLLSGAAPDLSALDGLGVVFLGANVSLKIWPSCRGTHGAISAGLALRGQGADPGALRRAAFRICPPDGMLLEPRADRLRPASAIAAKFSIPYCFAQAWLHGAPGLADFAAEARGREAVIVLAQKAHLESCAAENIPEVRLLWADGTQSTAPLSRPVEARACDPGARAAIAAKLAQCRGYGAEALAPLWAAIDAEDGAALPVDLLAAIRA